MTASQEAIVPGATHLYRRKAMYYWRRRLPNGLASWFHKRHLFLSLQAPDPNFARRLVVLLDAKLEEVVTACEHTEMHLTPSQVDGLLRDVVTTLKFKTCVLVCFAAGHRGDPLHEIKHAFRRAAFLMQNRVDDFCCLCFGEPAVAQ